VSEAAENLLDRIVALGEEGEIPDFVYDEEQDLFRFPQDGRFAFSREWADIDLLEE
jgi:hypothetical protein